MWHPPSESMLLRAVGGMTDTLHRPSGHLVSKDSLHAVCTWKESHGRKGPRLARTPAGRPGRGEAAALAHHGLAPQAAPVLQAQHAAAGLVARRALGAHGQVSLQPLVRHGDLRTERRHTLGTSHTGGGKAGSARRCPPAAPARAWQRLARTPEHGGPLQAGRKRTERGPGGRESLWSRCQRSLCTYPILVLDDVLPNGGQCGPLAVIRRTHSTPLVGLKLAHCERINTRTLKPQSRQPLPVLEMAVGRTARSPGKAGANTRHPCCELTPGTRAETDHGENRTAGVGRLSGKGQRATSSGFTGHTWSRPQLLKLHLQHKGHQGPRCIRMLKFNCHVIFCVTK